MAQYIVRSSKGENYNLIPLGSYADFPSGKLDLLYLTWYFGHEPSEQKEKIKYFVYPKSEPVNIKRANAMEKKDFQYMSIIKSN